MYTSHSFTSHPLDILFLTNFSDYCFRTIPAIAQLADTLKVRLTLMHVYDPSRTTPSAAEAQINSFFPEADRYAACHRIAVPGPLLLAVCQHLEAWPVNLILAPASDTFGFPHLGTASTRSQLIQKCGVPVWNIGRRVQLKRLARPVRNVACWLDFHSDDTRHLAFAMEYARKTKATLHLLRAIPEADEGLLHVAVKGNTLEPSRAGQEILDLCSTAPILPQVHVTQGEGASALAHLLRECDADVVFLRPEQSWLPERLGLGLRLGDGIPCPSIYIGDQLTIPRWNLEPANTHTFLAVPRNSSDSRNHLTAHRNGHAATAATWISELGLM